MKADRTIFLGGLIAAMAVIGPSPVAAGEPSATCDYNAASHKVTVDMDGSIAALLVRDGAGHIKVNEVWCDQAATVTNTDSIEVTGDLSDQTLIIDLANKGFRPGRTNEAGKSDEIELSINLEAGGGDSIVIQGTDAVQKIDLGETVSQFVTVRKVNLNAAESTGIDADVSITNAEIFIISAAGGNDVVRARGKAGTGPHPLSMRAFIYGGNGNDKLKGGSANDNLYGEAGVDVVWGFEGDDWMPLTDGAGGDIGHGGPGMDTCSPDPGDTCDI